MSLGKHNSATSRRHHSRVWLCPGKFPLQFAEGRLLSQVYIDDDFLLNPTCVEKHVHSYLDLGKSHQMSFMKFRAQIIVCVAEK